MGAFSKWLLREDQKELFEIFFAATQNVVFFSSPCCCGPFAKVGFAFRLTKGYVVLWAATYLATAILIRLHSVLKVNLYETLPQKSVTERRYGLAAGCEAALGAAVKGGAYQRATPSVRALPKRFNHFRAKPEPRAQPDH